ncbi:hypothetical protein Vadar_031255 [Vaccinium darrowii]|uniref:Uncharacterized protein n=1 Tax=Vaccinium darrowii TaxID=229202 RepID=A0ACB7X598_9ERIC|nr:hypothetical protein Vadar_031255 [Vaccinium darrowii]
MDSQQTSQSKASKGKGKPKDKGNDKEKQSRRLWTLKEEEVLLVYRATGEMAEDPLEIRDDDWEEEIDQFGHEESVVGTNDYYTSRFANGEFVFGGGGSTFIDLSVGGSQPPNPTTPASNGNASTPTSNPNPNANANSNANANPPPKKAKKVTRAEAKQKAIYDAFGSYMDESKEVMLKLVDNVGYDQKLSDKRIGVFPNLENLGLEMEDMLTANAMILASEERVDEFYSVPESVAQILENLFETKGRTKPNSISSSRRLQFLGFPFLLPHIFCCHSIWFVEGRFVGIRGLFDSKIKIEFGRLNDLMESKGGKKKSSSSSSSNSQLYEAPLGFIIEDVRPNGGIKKFRSAAYSNCARKPS